MEIEISISEASVFSIGIMPQPDHQCGGMGQPLKMEIGKKVEGELYYNFPITTVR
jgi:hypothetical protein